MFKLVIQDDEGKTTVVPLIRDEITIGRKEGNTIRLTERNVSRRHARILRNNGEVQIEDLGSYNGIRVNNARIAERVSLRVSDQVQIGDYKLYLKAEGVEQVDDAQTRPIERVDNQPTDVMSAVGATTATQPMSIPTTTPVPGTLIGNPNHTLVAISDTDPAGRPIARGGAVAALAAPAGYGKLVVLSSNFAGKEFELSRPQMIIGRTDENDIVINHRSISRNHAKLVREPETGRYTISDLQSSNGVRVNGQDYGKVELRRGDVVDLGHVRLRFVEPGEDFVFARDAVITDVPDASGKGRLVLAIVMAVIVIGAVVAVVTMMRGGKDKPDTGGGNGGGTMTGTGSASGAVETPDAAEVVAATPDASDSLPPPVTPDAAVGSSGAQSEVEVECLGYQSNQKWGDLDLCSQRLMAINPTVAKQLKDRAVLETRAVPRISAFEAAIKDRNLKTARAQLEQVSPQATSYAKLRQKYEQVENDAIRDLIRQLERVKDEDCKEYNQLLQQERSSKPPRIANEAQRQIKCTPAQQTPPPTACNHEEAAERGREHFANSQHAAALAAYEQAYNCKPEQTYAEKAFVVACNIPNLVKARLYWKRMPTGMRTRALGVCVRNGYTEEMLNGS
jgi:pSer/pThr/pTyr-binding forkhead associated (FHA) protein